MSLRNQIGLQTFAQGKAEIGRVFQTISREALYLLAIVIVAGVLLGLIGNSVYAAVATLEWYAQLAILIFGILCLYWLAVIFFGFSRLPIEEEIAFDMFQHPVTKHFDSPRWPTVHRFSVWTSSLEAPILVDIDSTDTFDFAARENTSSQLGEFVLAAHLWDIAQAGNSVGPKQAMKRVGVDKIAGSRPNRVLEALDLKRIPVPKGMKVLEGTTQEQYFQDMSYLSPTVEFRSRLCRLRLTATADTRRDRGQLNAVSIRIRVFLTAGKLAWFVPTVALRQLRWMDAVCQRISG